MIISPVQAGIRFVLILCILSKTMHLNGQEVCCDTTSCHAISLQEMYDVCRNNPNTTLSAISRTKHNIITFRADLFHRLDKSFFHKSTEYFTTMKSAFFVEAGYTYFFRPNPSGWGLHGEWNGGYVPTNTHNKNPEMTNTFLAGPEYLRSLPNGHRYIFRLMIGRSAENIPVQFSFEWELPRLFGVKGLSYGGLFDLWTSEFHFTDKEDISYKSNSLSFRMEHMVWYSLNRLFGGTASDSFHGQKGAGIFVKLRVNCNHPGGWHYGEDYGLNYGPNITPCIGLGWNF